MLITLRTHASVIHRIFLKLLQKFHLILFDILHVFDQNIDSESTQSMYYSKHENIHNPANDIFTI